MKIQDFQDNVTCGGFDNIFANIYKPQDIESQESRYKSSKVVVCIFAQEKTSTDKGVRNLFG